MQSRVAFLSDPSHQIVFHFTPKHCSWLNQIEIWFSILVRKLLRRASFTSTADLKARILDFLRSRAICRILLPAFGIDALFLNHIFRHLRAYLRLLR